MKHLLTALWICLLLVSGTMSAASPFQLNGTWTFLKAPLPTWEEIDVADISWLKRFSGEPVTLENGVFSRETETGVPALLIHTFDAPAEGTIWMRCGTNGARMQVGLNGKMLLDIRTAFFRTAEGGYGSHIIPLEVKKGSNTLNVKLMGKNEGSPDGKCRYLFAYSEANEKQYGRELPTRENFRNLFSADRHVAERIIRNGVDEMTAAIFAQFDHSPDLTVAELEKYYQENPILELYDRAMGKILKEVPQTKVEHGIVAWHVYNMGYVIKTPECCFGIDIHHRRARELAPLLDFILVTHNHGDHCNQRLFEEMSRRGKYLISNFYPAKGYQRPPAEFQIRDISIRTEETDHNGTLRKFMSVYRIKCGHNDNAPVIYHSGDNCSHRQLHPA